MGIRVSAMSFSVAPISWGHCSSCNAGIFPDLEAQLKAPLGSPPNWSHVLGTYLGFPQFALGTFQRKFPISEDIGVTPQFYLNWVLIIPATYGGTSPPPGSRWPGTYLSSPFQTALLGLP